MGIPQYIYKFRSSTARLALLISVDIHEKIVHRKEDVGLSMFV